MVEQQLVRMLVPSEDLQPGCTTKGFDRGAAQAAISRTGTSHTQSSCAPGDSKEPSTAALERFAAGLAQNDKYLNEAHVDNTRGDEPAQRWRNFRSSFALTMGGHPINFQDMKQTTYESMSGNIQAEKGVEDYIRSALGNGVHPGPALVGNGVSIDVTSPQGTLRDKHASLPAHQVVVTPVFDSPQGTFQGYAVTVRTRAPANVQEELYLSRLTPKSNLYMTDTGTVQSNDESFRLNSVYDSGKEGSSHPFHHYLERTTFIGADGRPSLPKDPPL